MMIEKKDRNLDNWAVKWNTPAARCAVINTPTSMDAFSFGSYIRDVGAVPDALVAWLDANRQAAVQSARRRSLILYGKPGTGKTGLGVCALRELAAACVGKMFTWNMATSPGVRASVASGEDPQRPSPVWFERWSRLLLHHRSAKWDELGWFEQIEDRVTVLMLDDITVDTGTQFRESLLLNHFEWAEDRDDRALILTMNESPDELIKRKVFTERITDRICEARRFDLVEVSGGSRR